MVNNKDQTPRDKIKMYTSLKNEAKTKSKEFEWICASRLSSFWRTEAGGFVRVRLLTFSSPLATLKASSTTLPAAIRDAVEVCDSFQMVSLSTWFLQENNASYSPRWKLNLSWFFGNHWRKLLPSEVLTYGIPSFGSSFSPALLAKTGTNVQPIHSRNVRHVFHPRLWTCCSR